MKNHLVTFRHFAKQLTSVIIIVLWMVCFNGCTVGSAAPLKIREAREMADRGTAFLQLNMVDEALAAYRVSRQITETPQAADGTACALLVKGDISGAAVQFEQLVRSYPDYGQGKANYAQLLEREGKTRRAQQLYRLGLQKNLKNYKIRNNFGAHLAEYTDRDAQLAGQELLYEAFAQSQIPVIAQNLSKLKSPSGSEIADN